MPKLITVPTFTFSQGDVYNGTGLPITVRYYNGSEADTHIKLNQGDNAIDFTNIAQLKALVKEIEKHHAAAQKQLNK